MIRSRPYLRLATPLTGCSASAELIANVTDDCEATEDAELKVNVGGLSAASTVNAASQIDAVMRVAVSRPIGASNVSVGGMSGSQRCPFCFAIKSAKGNKDFQKSIKL